MSAPFVPGRVAQPLDLLANGPAGDGWDGLDNLLAPFVDADLQPPDRVAMWLWGMYSGGESREVIEWLMDITLRLPLRSTGATFEQTALMTATRQGINGVGEAVLKAIAKGNELADKAAASRRYQSQNGAGE